MSRGQFKPNHQSSKVLRGCKNKEDTNKVAVFDVDDEKIDYVSLGTAECSRNCSRHMRESRYKEKSRIPNIINIDDEEGNFSNGVEDDDTMSRSSCPSPSSSHVLDENDDDECVVVREQKTSQDLSKKEKNVDFSSSRVSERAFQSGFPSRDNYDVSSSESEMSEDVIIESDPFEVESSDCEIVDDSCGNIREEWEQAASRKGKQDGTHNEPEGHASVSESGSEPGIAFNGTFDKYGKSSGGFACNLDVNNNDSPFYNTDEFQGSFYWHPFEFSDYNQEVQFQPTEQLNFEVPPVKDSAEQNFSSLNSDTDELKRENTCREEEALESMNGIQRKSLVASNGNLDGETKSCNSLLGSDGVDDDSHIEIMLGEREKHKESEEFRRAAEEEWAARQEQLRIQAEEVHRLRKRKREERRLLDMEQRQKQRLEEVRESQKKNEETMNLKDEIRMEVQKQLDFMEWKYKDMTSLLRGLGIEVLGGPFPSLQEVNAAYRRALLKFHPDRASKTDIRQQVEAEEKFKLISRLKEKLVPSVHPSPFSKF